MSVRAGIFLELGESIEEMIVAGLRARAHTCHNLTAARERMNGLLAEIETGINEGDGEDGTYH